MKLPIELAEEIVAEGVAEELIPLRGPLTDGTLGIVVEGINAASAAVSVGLGVAAIRRFSRSVIGRLRARGQPGRIELRMPSTNGERRLTLSVDDPHVEDKILDFIIESLPASPPDGRDSHADSD
ncbi:hypothetical protein [Humibacillus xanthopallidus]|uniref:hypothetical protein n=1 Tax=Humibacillus xanthopallidus TaxID=412689 RepID=UPI00384EA878